MPLLRNVRYCATQCPVLTLLGLLPGFSLSTAGVVTTFQIVTRDRYLNVKSSGTGWGWTVTVAHEQRNVSTAADVLDLDDGSFPSLVLLFVPRSQVRQYYYLNRARVCTAASSTDKGYPGTRPLSSVLLAHTQFHIHVSASRKPSKFYFILGKTHAFQY